MANNQQPPPLWHILLVWGGLLLLTWLVQQASTWMIGWLGATIGLDWTGMGLLLLLVALLAGLRRLTATGMRVGPGGCLNIYLLYVGYGSLAVEWLFAWGAAQTDLSWAVPLVILLLIVVLFGALHRFMWPLTYHLVRIFPDVSAVGGGLSESLLLLLFNPRIVPRLAFEMQYRVAARLLVDQVGDKAANIEEAIKRYQSLLETFGPRIGPQKQAELLKLLGKCYDARICGDRAENLEQAIAFHQQARERLSPDQQPTAWADCTMELVGSYILRTRGDAEENQEYAIRLVAEVLDQPRSRLAPRKWAEYQAALGGIYSLRIRGDRRQNHEQARSYYAQALQVLSVRTNPIGWARTTYALATLDAVMPDDTEERQEAAFGYYRQVLDALPRHAFPREWAHIMTTQGNIYAQRSAGDRGANLEAAIDCYTQALEVITRENDPVQWSRIMTRLADAYLYRKYGNATEDLELAEASFLQALEVQQAQSLPLEQADIAGRLGFLFYLQQRYADARRVLELFHAAMQNLRGEVQRNTARRRLSEHGAEGYAVLVACCLHLRDFDAAFFYAAAGKGQAFVDLLASARFDLSAAGADNPNLAADLEHARRLRQQMDALLALLSGGEGDTLPTQRAMADEAPDPPAIDRQELRRLQAAEQAHWEELALKYPALTATQQTPTLSPDAARELAAALGCTLVEYYQHDAGWCAFVITPTLINHVPLPDITDDLITRMRKWVQRIESPTGRGKTSYAALTRWHTAVIAPVRPYLPPNRTVVLAPFGLLHTLPLSIALNPLTQRYFVDDYTLLFAPSLAALAVAFAEEAGRTGALQRRAPGGEDDGPPKALLSVAYPGPDPAGTDYLPNALLEAQAIARSFEGYVTPLHNDQATPDAVIRQASTHLVIHLGCHGWFDAEQPDQSGLLLAQGWLTIQRIITELNLRQTHLVTLAACLSGRAAIAPGDELSGLAQAILTAGAPIVVASLWRVDDGSTHALFATFYRHVAAGQAPAAAMRQALHVVRTELRLAHPYYWAAFQVFGLGHAPRRLALDLAPHPLPSREQQRSPTMTRQKRGAHMNNEQQKAQMIQGAIDLLEQLAEEPEPLVANLSAADLQALAGSLHRLAKQAETVQNMADLLVLSDAVHLVIERNPTLRTWLMDEQPVGPAQAQRSALLHDFLAADQQQTQAQEYVAVIHNHLIECRQELERILQVQAPSPAPSTTQATPEQGS